MLTKFSNDFEDALQKVDQILASKSEHEKSDAVISKAIVLLEYVSHRAVK